MSAILFFPNIRILSCKSAAMTRSNSQNKSLFYCRPGVLPPRQSQQLSLVNAYNWTELQCYCSFFFSQLFASGSLVGQGYAHLFLNVNLIKETAGGKYCSLCNTPKMILSTTLTNTFRPLNASIVLINNQSGQIGQIGLFLTNVTENLIYSKTLKIIIVTLPTVRYPGFIVVTN